MLGIIGIIALLTVLGLSLFITRLAAVALSMTGMSRAAASFQARSAFTGTGFTTEESEQIVNHPVRRRIVMMLMILRSAGLVTIVISIILSFAGAANPMQLLYRLGWLIGGVAALLILEHLPVVDYTLERAIGWALDRWTDLDVRDYARLLKVSGEYTITEMHVDEGDWVEGKELRECDLGQEGVTVLGIERQDGDYVGAPHGSSAIHAGDTLILYGRNDTLAELDKRRGGGAGDAAHQRAIGEQQQHIRRQEQQEQEHEQQREDQASATS
ncbi:MAG: TrkA C-terminal domain-containing protein [Phycisphaerae bacterium]